jgi:hypothetical protein
MRSGPLFYPKPQNEQHWETWCRLIFARVLGLSHPQKFEVRGKDPKGIDLLGCRDDGTYVSVQCKLRNTGTPLKQKEAEADVQKAKELKRKITDLVFATTHDIDDAIDALPAPERRAVDCAG